MLRLVVVVAVVVVAAAVYFSALILDGGKVECKLWGGRHCTALHCTVGLSIYKSSRQSEVRSTSQCPKC